MAISLFTTKKDDKILAKIAVNAKAKPIKQKLCTTEQEAQAFFQAHLQQLKVNKKKRQKIRKLFENMSFKEMAEYVKQEAQSDTTPKLAKHVFERVLDDFRMDVISYQTMLKDMFIEQAIDYSGDKVGYSYTVAYQKALSGELDALIEQMDTEANQNTNNLMGQVVYISNDTLNYEGSEQAQDIVNKLRTIPGSKIITITTDYATEKFDINAEGVVGYAPTHLGMLCEMIDDALETTGSMIIRQFIPNSEEKKIINGKEMMIPHKALYGLMMKESEIYALPAEEVEYCCTHDMNDQPLPAEEMVIFRDISEFFA